MQTLYEIYLQDLPDTLFPINSYLWFVFQMGYVLRCHWYSKNYVSISTHEFCFGREYATLQLSPFLGDSLTKISTKLKCSVQSFLPNRCFHFCNQGSKSWHCLQRGNPIFTSNLKIQLLPLKTTFLLSSSTLCSLVWKLNHAEKKPTKQPLKNLANRLYFW